MPRSLSLAALLSLALPLAAQTTPPRTVANPDGSITFRYTDSGAGKVVVETDAFLSAKPMTRGPNSVWTLTTDPLPPEHYGYSFVVDGVSQLDPLNHEVRDNLVGLSSDILVPGHPAMPWELKDIPHGRTSRFEYTTHAAQNLPANQAAYVVYTPPGYDGRRKSGYPVLYLLHGWSDTETGWDSVGEANLILDSMLAGGKIVPMIVVMPLGYGDFHFVTGGHSVWNSPAQVDGNTSLFSKLLTTEVMPAVERDYNTAPGRENRAIAGLSMGGLESLSIGLQHPELFAWVGGFSSAIQHRHFDEHFPGLTAAGLAAKHQPLRLLWVACGKDDALAPPNRDFVAWAKGKDFPVTAIETPGRHTWLVWRDNLLNFAPLLFRTQ